MLRETTHSGILGSWQRLLAPLSDLPTGLAHLLPLRDKLATMLGRAVDVIRLQTGFAADKQELSQELERLIADGGRVATALRVNIKEHYGPQAEKLTAFGLQPFRGRHSTAPEPPAPEVAAPAAADTTSDT